MKIRLGGAEEYRFVSLPQVPRFGCLLPFMTDRKRLWIQPVDATVESTAKSGHSLVMFSKSEIS